VVSHRITSIAYAADGSLSFRTRGDHNGQGDPDPVRAVQVRGRVWYAVPYAGYVTVWISGRTRIVVSATVAAVLVGYALALFAAGLRDRRRDRQDPEPGRVDPVAATGGHDRAGGRR
jgi:signal peptidase